VDALGLIRMRSDSSPELDSPGDRVLMVGPAGNSSNCSLAFALAATLSRSSRLAYPSPGRVLAHWSRAASTRSDNPSTESRRRR